MKVGREMKIKLKEISRDDLKVGDTVGIARTVNCGWLSTFRHRKIIPVKITRITPKRTKIETDIYEEHGKGEKFYEYDENARKENELAEKFVLVKDMEFELNQFENKYGLKRMDDEDILEMADYVEKIMKILGKYRKK
jgi:hypothetical protein|nr:MAG TPA_asm: hypothetical protein [Caudoviricetes sp.]